MAIAINIDKLERPSGGSYKNNTGSKYQGVDSNEHIDNDYNTHHNTNTDNIDQGGTNDIESNIPPRPLATTATELTYCRLDITHSNDNKSFDDLHLLETLEIDK